MKEEVLMELEYKGLKVKGEQIIIDAEQVDEPEVLLDAWKVSRPDAKIDDNTLSEILKLDLPILEMVHVTLTCKVPVILREIITTLRDHIMWAKTSRVDRISEYFEIYNRAMETKDDCEYIYEVMKQMMDEKEQGIPQDKYRRLLPLSYMTSFTYKVSLRTLGKLMCHIGWISDKYPTLKYLYNDVMSELHGTLPEMYVHYLMEQSNKNHINYNEFTDFDGESIINNQSYLAMNLKDIPIGLRAQLVRSRSIQIQDNLLDAFAEKGWQSDNTMKLKVSICSSVTFLLQLVSKRNCWLAQKDLWEPILRLLNKCLGDKIVLPCSCNGGKCPVFKDCVERLEGTDPGVPCPMMYLLHYSEVKDKYPLGVIQVDRIVDYAKDTDRCDALKRAAYKLNESVPREMKGE